MAVFYFLVCVYFCDCILWENLGCDQALHAVFWEMGGRTKPLGLLWYHLHPTAALVFAGIADIIWCQCCPLAPVVHFDRSS